jgi:hypothetical protein
MPPLVKTLWDVSAITNLLYRFSATYYNRAGSGGSTTSRMPRLPRLSFFAALRISVQDHFLSGREILRCAQNDRHGNCFKGKVNAPELAGP